MRLVERDTVRDTQRVLPSAAQRARIAEGLKRGLASHCLCAGAGAARCVLWALGSWLLALGSWLLALGSWLLGPRMTAAGGWRKARRVARTDAGQFFARAGCPVEKPRNPLAYLEGQRPGRRGIRGAVSFGYFSLGKQRKVTRPPAGGRKPAAGEPGRDIATTKCKVTGSRPTPG